MKQCSKCGISKPFQEFYSNARMKSGILNKCKVCSRIDVRRYRRKNESVRDYDRDRAKDSSRKAKMEKTSKLWRLKNPQKYKAQTSLGNALRDGKIEKEPCYFCGAAKVHGHHQDYSKPLDVTWLCAKCHHRYHALKKLAS